MGDRVYTCPLPSATVGTAVQDICAIIGTTVKGGTLHHIELYCNTSTEGVARVRLKRGSAVVTAGSAGTAGSPVPVDPADAAVTVAVRCNDTTQATTTGAFVTLAEYYWDTALPLTILPSPEDREKFAVSGALILDLPAVLGASIVVDGFVKFSESP